MIPSLPQDPGAPFRSAARPGQQHHPRRAPRRHSRRGDLRASSFEFGFLLGRRTAAIIQPADAPRRRCWCSRPSAPPNSDAGAASRSRRSTPGRKPVPTTRATIVRPVRSSRTEATPSFRACAPAVQGAARGHLGILNRACTAWRASTAVPLRVEHSTRTCLVARIGSGPASPCPSRTLSRARRSSPPGARRARRSMTPEERFAALLGGTRRAARRRRSWCSGSRDVDARRMREAALQARVALEACWRSSPRRRPRISSGSGHRWRTRRPRCCAATSAGSRSGSRDASSASRRRCVDAPRRFGARSASRIFTVRFRPVLNSSAMEPVTTRAVAAAAPTTNGLAIVPPPAARPGREGLDQRPRDRRSAAARRPSVSPVRLSATSVRLRITRAAARRQALDQPREHVTPLGSRSVTVELPPGRSSPGTRTAEGSARAQQPPQTS